MDKDKIFDNWVQKYSKTLLERATYILSNKEDAKDIVQEVFINAYTSYNSFKNNSSPSTWLFSILNNKIADYYKKKYKKPIEYSISQYFSEDGHWKDNTQNTTWEEYTEEKITQKLHNCIEQLPNRIKIIVKLYYINQKNTKDLCQEVGITPTNLWKILQRSRIQLKTCIEKNNI